MVGTAVATKTTGRYGQKPVNYEIASPTLLAAQPTAPKKRQQTQSPAWLVLQQHLEARLAMLRNWRLSWAQHWALLATYILPRRNTWLTQGAGIGGQPVPNSMIRGLPINNNIVDPTGTQAMRICASGLMSGLMSPTRPWFKIKPSNERLENDTDAMAWCDQVEAIIYAIMAGSNFYESGAQMFEDLTTFGTSPVIIYEDYYDVIRCYNPCAGEYYIASSSANRPETLVRQFVMNISQIVEMFGLEVCPPDVTSLWKTKGSALEQERLIAHCIEPNFQITDDKRQSVYDLLDERFTWRESYWLWGVSTTQPLSIRGFEDQPHVVPRWAVTSNDAYGRSIAMDVLPDIMQLQVETKRKAEAIEKLVRPPLLADVSLKNQPSSILPGNVTYVANLAGQNGMRPIYEVKPDIAAMMNDIAQMQQRINRGFLTDMFMMLDQMEGVQPRNEMEISERRSEKMQQIGPVIERFQSEFAGPAIKRIFNIAVRKRLMPPPPQSMRGSALSLEYVSALAIAQRGAQTATMERFIGLVGNMGAAYPEAKAKVDPLAFLDEYARMINVPVKILNSDQKVNQMMQQMAKQAQSQQAAAMAGQAVDAANTLSQTKVGEGNTALDHILGTGPGGQAGGTA